MFFFLGRFFAVLSKCLGFLYFLHRFLSYFVVVFTYHAFDFLGRIDGEQKLAKGKIRLFPYPSSQQMSMAV